MRRRTYAYSVGTIVGTCVTLVGAKFLMNAGIKDNNISFVISVIIGIMCGFIVVKIWKYFEISMEKLIDKGFDTIENKINEKKNNKIANKCEDLKDLYNDMNKK